MPYNSKITVAAHLPLNNVSPRQETSVLRTAFVHGPERITFVEDNEELRFNMALART